MVEGESLFYDVLVIGSGIAGIRAALEARAGGCSVLVLSKGPAGKQTASFYSGGHLRPEGQAIKDVQVPGYDTGIGKYLYLPELVKLYKEEAKKEFERLIALGVPLQRRVMEYRASVDYMPAGGQSAPGGSFLMLPLVKRATVAGVTFLSNKLAVDLLVSQGRVKGVLAMDEKEKLLKIGASVTILATGGGAGSFIYNSNHTYPEGISGDGYVMALRAGASLLNMEFIHFNPLNLVGGSFPHQGVTHDLEPYDGFMIVNGKDEDIVKKHWGITACMALSIPTVRFGMLPRIVAQEAKEEGGVYIDLTRISSDEWNRFLSSPWQRAWFQKAPVNLQKQKCPIVPLAYTFLGGVKTDAKGSTSVPGLLAAGEVAGGSYYGDEGANQQLRCSVMGAIAGRSAVSFVKQMKSVKVGEREWQAAISGVEKKLAEKGGRESPAELKKDIGRLLDQCFGPLRDGATLESGLKELEILIKKMDSVANASSNRVRNILEADKRLMLAGVLLGSALRRRESRGPHFRSDFPAKDEGWYKRIVVSLDKKEAQLKFAEEKIE